MRVPPVRPGTRKPRLAEHLDREARPLERPGIGLQRETCGT